tara:strand:- start:209 stop:874 length:666 start_codon:yes stop_codon:yes gene_type:complete
MKLKFIYFIIFIISLLIGNNSVPVGAFSVTRIHYGGGGDWYCDPSSLPNLLKFVEKNTNIVIDPIEKRARIGEDDFYASSHLYMTGHGNIKFSDEEAQILRDYLIGGAFLHADDNYGMDKSFRKEMNKVFPELDWVEIPPDHEIFHIVFSFPDGLPKVHEHDNKRPQALGLFYEGQLVVLYTYESDLGDGWEDPEVHDDPVEIRKSALQMGTNIIVYGLIR